MIEVTATDLTKANIVLNTICAMFSEYCSDKFSVEAVQVEHSDGTTTITPDLSDKTLEASIDYINTSVGIKLEPDTIASILKKMSLSCKLIEDKSKLKVSVPITRSDVIHACDVMEDVAIAYGYNKLDRISPKTVTQGKQQILNKVSDFIRREVAFAGFSEVLTLSLVIFYSSFHSNLFSVQEKKIINC